MPRVVLDTNVLISAFISEGAPFGIYKLWRQGEFRLIISEYILGEFRRIGEGKVHFNHEKLTRALWELSTQTEMVNPMKVYENLVEENDWPILGTAVAGKADYLVSGDRMLLKLKHYADIPIISPKQFLVEVDANKGIVRKV